MLILANLPGTSSPRAMVSVAWSSLSAHRLDRHVWDFAHHSLRDPGQSALRTFTSGRKDTLSTARRAVWVVHPGGQAPEALQTRERCSLSQAWSGCVHLAAGECDF